MCYTNPIKWELDNASPKELSFNDHTGTQVVSFLPYDFSRDYALGLPQHILSAKFHDATMSQFNLEEVVKSWMENPVEYVHKPTNSYLV